MVDPQIEYQAEMLAQKTKHYLITQMGRVLQEANADEIYRALAYALREEVMINWAATVKTLAEQKERVVYYLSLEYMPGRITTNNTVNMCIQPLLLITMHKLNRPFKEIANREFDPGLGNGGLGRLASCFMDSLATMHYPAMGYGLRYQYGIFEQQLWDGAQIEAPDLWLMNENPWEFRRDLRRVGIKFCGVAKAQTNIHGDEIYSLEGAEEVWALPYDIPIVGYSNAQDFSVATLRMWTTKESPRNFQLQRYNAGRLDQAAENTTLTDVLYPSDWHDAGKRVRLKQEFLLVSASLQDIIRRYLEQHDNFRDFEHKVRIQINDTHPALVIAELMHLLTKIYDLPWKRAQEITRNVTSYTNHTVMTEALEQWDHTLMEYLLPRQTKIIEKLNQEICDEVRTRFPENEEKVQAISVLHEGKVRMANLAICGSHAVNGVAAMHSKILKESVFKDFYEMWPDRFFNVTNGVTQRRWLHLCNRDLSTAITKKIGDGWITDFSQMERLREFANDAGFKQELMEIKMRNKQKLVDFIRHHVKIRDRQGQVIGTPPVIDTSSIFDVQIKRFHEYKRQLMNALHCLMLYHEIKEGGTRDKRTVIFAGKAAASYEMAKDIIHFIAAVAKKVNKDPETSKYLKVVFIENYNVSKAEVIIPAADLSEQISTAGYEASGTGNMKLAMNGALTIGTDDGANVEMRESVTDAYWPFRFGMSVEEVNTLRGSNSYDPFSLAHDHPLLRKAMDSLRNGDLADSEEDNQIFHRIYDALMRGSVESPADHYFVIQDLIPLYETQKKVEVLYNNPEDWTEYVIHNIAGMGPFSTDNSIRRYAEDIWGIKPMPINPDILEQVRQEYREHDKCRIF